MVFLSHALWTKAASNALSFGDAGVAFFFVLSGFVLSLNYRGNFSMRRFYAARCARVVPIYVVGIVLAVAALGFAGGEIWSHSTARERAIAVVLQFSLLQSWFPQTWIHFGINAPAWSLSDEAFFYATFPLAAVAIARGVRSQGVRAPLISAAVCWTVLVAVLAPQKAVVFQWHYYVLPLVRFVDFFIGMLLGTAFVQRSVRAIASAKGTAFEIGAIASFVVGLVVTLQLPQSLRFSASMLPFFCALVWVFALQHGAIARALGSPIAVRLGEASFAFYIVHLSVIRVAEALFPTAPVLSFVVAFATSLGISLALYAHVETPMRAAIRSRYSRELPSRWRRIAFRGNVA